MDSGSELALLQRIYVGVADTDPDGVRGVMALRKEPASASERARDLEQLGRWNDALVYHQEALSHHQAHDQQNNSEKLTEHGIGLVRCLCRIGQFDNAIGTVVVVISHPTLTIIPAQVRALPMVSEIVSLGVGAAWRSADYKALSELLDFHPGLMLLSSVQCCRSNIVPRSCLTRSWSRLLDPCMVEGRRNSAANAQPGKNVAGCGS